MSDKFDPRRELNNLRETVEKALQQGSTVAGKAIQQGTNVAGKVINQGIQTVQNATGGTSPMRMDVYELDDEMVIRVSPIDGIIADSIEVSMEGTTLTLALQSAADEVSPKATYLMHERKFGIFSRSIELEIPVKANQAKAKLNRDGTLTITLPVDVARIQQMRIDQDKE
jgi:HSP20 family molecular chaperone IbpA